MTNEEKRAYVFNEVKPVPFEEYKELFAPWIILTREDGIVEARMHTNGNEPATWTYGMHAGIGKLAKYIAQDVENQVLIITGTGDKWITFADMGQYGDVLLESAAKDMRQYAKRTYDDWYMHGKELLKAWLFELQIPTIAAINGPSPAGHNEFALACDLTLCTPDADFFDGHYAIDLAPGDGQYLALRHLLGDKRTNELIYTARRLDAQTAKEWGLVNEVLPREELMPRARELAKQIMKASYHTRRLTHQMMTDSWRQDVLDNLDKQFGYEGWAASMIGPAGGLKTIQEDDKFSNG